MTDEECRQVWRGLMRFWSSLCQLMDWPKGDLLDAVLHTRDWIEANQANWNAGLPASVKNNATAAQKTLLFCAVALAMAGLLRRVFGEVD